MQGANTNVNNWAATSDKHLLLIIDLYSNLERLHSACDHPRDFVSRLRLIDFQLSSGGARSAFRFCQYTKTSTGKQEKIDKVVLAVLLFSGHRLFVRHVEQLSTEMADAKRRRNLGDNAAPQRSAACASVMY